MKQDKQLKVCGECVWFYGEDTYGYGICPFQFGEETCCEDDCVIPHYFVSREQARHHLAVLVQSNRWRRDPNVPAIYKMPQPKEVGEAIDFTIKFTKTFMDL